MREGMGQLLTTPEKVWRVGMTNLFFCSSFNYYSRWGNPKFNSCMSSGFWDIAYSKTFFSNGEHLAWREGLLDVFLE